MEENRLLKAKLSARRIHFTDVERRRLIFVGEASLRRAIREYAAHYHFERNHQGLRNRLIAANEDRFCPDEKIASSARLGGLLKFYYREVA